MVDSLSLELVEYEENSPTYGDYLKLKASVGTDRFSGSISFWLCAQDLASFLEELRNFLASLRGGATLKAGIGSDVHFEIRFSMSDERGHIRVGIQISHPPREEESDHSRLIVEIISEVQLIDSFRKQLLNLLGSRTIDEPAILTGRR